MPRLLKDINVTAMSLIFDKGANGESWAPRNQDAKILTVKGAAQAAPTSGTSTYDALVAKFGAERAAVAKGLWVKDGTPDNVDGDDDGAQDYEQMLAVLFGAATIQAGPNPYGWDYWCSNGGLVGDLQRSMQIQDADMRSAAIAIGLDNFLAAIDDIRSGGDGLKEAAAIKAFAEGAAVAAADTTPTVVDKAGARHSAADKKTIDQIGQHAAAITKLHGELSKSQPAASDGEGEDDATKPAAEKAAPETAPAPVPVAETVAAPAAATPAASDVAQPTTFDGIVTLADGSTVTIKDGVVIGKAEKAAPEPAASINANQIAEIVKGVVSEQLTSHAATIDTRLTAIETNVAKAAAVTPPTPIELSLGLIKAAREPSAPAGSPHLDSTATTFKANPLIERAAQPELDLRTATVRDVVQRARLVSA